jgi:hypothetical protein
MVVMKTLNISFNGWVQACANGRVGGMGGLHGWVERWCRYGGIGGVGMGGFINISVNV